MTSEELVTTLASLITNIDDKYAEIQGLAHKLVGSSILYVRGTTQQVFAHVHSVCPQSLRIVVINSDTNRKYEVDITTIQIQKVFSGKE